MFVQSCARSLRSFLRRTPHCLPTRPSNFVFMLHSCSKHSCEIGSSSATVPTRAWIGGRCQGEGRLPCLLSCAQRSVWCLHPDVVLQTNATQSQGQDIPFEQYSLFASRGRTFSLIFSALACTRSFFLRSAATSSSHLACLSCQSA
mgnify:CR=1 FL=1